MHDVVVKPTTRANTHRQNQNVLCFGRFGFANACSDPILAFALSGRELLGAIFHRALPCAMGLLPRWGVKKFATT
ncbi:MAG: hypothetical protein LBQ66_11695 [Planctomycetaceae bacterium]|jgi:hypothetical protein|nr:hypothetical protein [Planctomycetaceae bacterium]